MRYAVWHCFIANYVKGSYISRVASSGSVSFLCHSGMIKKVIASNEASLLLFMRENETSQNTVFFKTYLFRNITVMKQCIASSLTER